MKRRQSVAIQQHREEENINGCLAKAMKMAAAENDGQLSIIND